MSGPMVFAITFGAPGGPTTLIVAKETTVEIEVLNRLVLEHVTVLPFIAAVMLTVKLEDRQYVASDAGPLEAV